ncbi:MAG: hypothetical protein GC185_12860 [Alphaproteobacteria bacterium]|nr:hypothetical protein [Alphaproteobacteria bacterium]
MTDKKPPDALPDLHAMFDHLGKVGDFVPRELAGFVIAIVAVVGIVFIYFMLRLLTPDTDRMSEKRKRKSAKKTRTLAMVLNFMVDDVEREMPDVSTDGMSYVMMRGACQRYHYPQIIRNPVEWRVLYRPGDHSADFIPGFELEVTRGKMADEYREKLEDLVALIAPPGEFFEMEVVHQALYFYWNEHGGRKTVEKLLTAVKVLKDMN